MIDYSSIEELNDKLAPRGLILSLIISGLRSTQNVWSASFHGKDDGEVH